MNDQKPAHYLAETIAEVTNLKALEIYRDESRVPHEARILDTELNDLARRILEAIAQVPEPDEYETWLKEKNLVLEYPDNQEQPPAAPVFPPSQEAASPPGSLNGGGDPDLSTKLKKGKTDMGRPKKKTNEISQTARQLIDDIQAFKLRERHTNATLAKLIGISAGTMTNIYKGDQVSEKTINKVRAVIEKGPPRKMNGGTSGVANLLQANLAVWMGRERLDNKGAAKRLGISERTLKDVQGGILPRDSVIEKIGARVPDIRKSMYEIKKSLRAAANGHART